MSKKIDVNEQDHFHWQNRLWIDIGKLGIADKEEFFRLCELRRRPVPQARRTDYRWLHYQRAEKLKEWSQEDNRALLDADADVQLERKPTAREMQRHRQH